ncbi:MAG: hypothetical protein H7235_10265, partial [Bdellovibrionaceae bacterium]|nr:hypothetical protein [Pseudobdellovibrionaceae bacterium]
FAILTTSVFSYGAAPKVGRTAAARYFQLEKKAERRSMASNDSDPSYPSSTSSSGSHLKDHFMALGFGTFSDAIAYNWAHNGKESNIGKWGADLTYRFSEQDHLFDESLRISYNEYKPADQAASKLSILYAITFPEASSKFPIYFGVAGGLGVYLKQIDQESLVSFDYQLYLGLRAFNLFDSVGVYVEGGMRNHLHITSDGQFNGTFLSLGTIFNF